MAILKLGRSLRKQEITPSTAYRAFLPCSQAVGSGSAVDRSGQGNDASYIGAGITDAQMWAVAGYASSINGNDSGFGIPASVSLWDLSNNESLIFCVDIKMPLPVSDGVLGNVKTGTQGAGFRFIAGAASSIKAGIKDLSNNNSSQITMNGVLDGASHRVILTVDAITKMMTVYDNTVSSTPLDISAITGATAPSNFPFSFGNDGDTGVGKTYDGSFRDIHILSISGGLPSNILEIVNLYQSRLYTPFSVDEIGV